MFCQMVHGSVNAFIVLQSMLKTHNAALILLAGSSCHLSELSCTAEDGSRGGAIATQGYHEHAPQAGIHGSP
jgi:hypothetical protein